MWGQAYGRVEKQLKKFRGSLSWKGNLKGWLCDYEHFPAGSTQAKESFWQPVEERWSFFTLSTLIDPLFRAADQLHQWGSTHRAIWTIQIKLILVIPPCFMSSPQQAPAECRAERGLTCDGAAHRLPSPSPSHQGTFSYHLLFNLSYWPAFYLYQAIYKRNYFLPEVSLGGEHVSEEQ